MRPNFRLSDLIRLAEDATVNAARAAATKTGELVFEMKARSAARALAKDLLTPEEIMERQLIEQRALEIIEERKPVYLRKIVE